MEIKFVRRISGFEDSIIDIIVLDCIFLYTKCNLTAILIFCHVIISGLIG